MMVTVFQIPIPILSLKVILANGPSLPAGTHYIPFSLNLPHGTPATFEGQHGHVRWPIFVLTLAEAL